MNLDDSFSKFKYCPNCGKRNIENSSTCWKCGIDFLMFKPNIHEEKKKQVRNPKKWIYRRLFLIIPIVIVLVLLLKAKDIYYDIKGEKDITSEFENGTIEENYKLIKINGNWLRNGPYNSYYENGKLKSNCVYRNGRIEGKCKSYYNNGKLEGECIYKNDQLDGEYKSYYENASIDTAIRYFHGLKAGRFYKYSRQNKVLVKGCYTNDIEDSLWTFKNDMGIVTEKIFYSYGKILEENHFWDNGNAEHFIKYDKDTILEDYFDINGYNSINKVAGHYEKTDEGIHSDALISYGSTELEIYPSKKYFKKLHSYFSSYQDPTIDLENIKLSRGLVKVTHDSIFFFVQETKKELSRSFIPSVDNTKWMDDSETNWKKTEDNYDNESLSIVEFLKSYKK